MKTNPPAPRLRVLDSRAPSSCTAVRGGLTDREVSLLARMRGLKEALRSASPEAAPGLRSSLEALKVEREEARRERMDLLDHSPEAGP